MKAISFNANSLLLAFAISEAAMLIVAIAIAIIAAVKTILLTMLLNFFATFVACY